jgi:sulfoxide reductase heme-binding subunit YedZ
LLWLAAPANPLWYATRGTGTVAFVLLSISVGLGLLTSSKWQAAGWPRFLVFDLHRDISLLAVSFGVIHVATSLLDPFAKLGLTDALVPFASSYRPIWLGLGVISAELMAAMITTSLLRQRIGYRLWKVIHWAAYATWPTALLHSIGTGTDVRRYWFLESVGVCVIAVIGVYVLIRLAFGWPAHAAARLVAAAVSGLAVVSIVLFMLNGPLVPGWARIAGTPQSLLQTAQPSPPP